MAYSLTCEYVSGSSPYYKVIGWSYITVLDNVVIPDTYDDGTNGSYPITYIGYGAFKDCGALTRITIGSNITYIDDEAFAWCDKLVSITIPSGVTSIGWGAFVGCSNLISASSKYKAFDIKDGKLYCIGEEYTVGKTNIIVGELALCKTGIHYCTNLFEIFNYYNGNFSDDNANIAICEIETGDKITTGDTSKCCTNSCTPTKRLSHDEIIKILNGVKS